MLIVSSCFKDTFIRPPYTIDKALEQKPFIREFVPNHTLIAMDKGYIIKEAYLTYFIDSNHVYKHTQVLIIKTYDLENHEFDTPICENLEIVIDTSKYSVGHRSGCLERDIPIKTTQFKFYYLDKII